jgi:RimJ/RimL family protein N-acetyltransferase
MQALLREAALLPGLEQLDLTVTEGNDAARTLYARSGFVEWGRLPRAVRIGQQYLAKVHMARPLR